MKSIEWNRLLMLHYLWKTEIAHESGMRWLTSAMLGGSIGCGWSGDPGQIDD